MNDIFVASKHIPETKSENFGAEYSENMSAFSSFCENPQGISFQTQKPNELITLFLRAHFVLNISWITISLILILLPIIILIFLPRLGVNFISSEIAIRFTVVYVVFYYLIVSSYLFINFLHWFYNVFIVTTERVVDVDYSDIVIHNIAVTSLTHIQDVNYTQSGFIPTLFNYGDLFVQTAGNEKNFEAHNIPNPRKATHIIGDIIGLKK